MHCCDILAHIIYIISTIVYKYYTVQRNGNHKKLILWNTKPWAMEVNSCLAHFPSLIPWEYIISSTGSNGSFSLIFASEILVQRFLSHPFRFASPVNHAYGENLHGGLKFTKQC